MDYRCVASLSFNAVRNPGLRLERLASVRQWDLAVVRCIRHASLRPVRVPWARVPAWEVGLVLALPF